MKIFLQIVHVENFFQNFDKVFSMSVFLDFFCFITFSGVSQRWESKNTTKDFLQKKIVSNGFHKKFNKKTQTIFFSIFFITFLGVS
jgi:hypothetical protein